MSDDTDFDEKDLKRRMDGAIEALRKEFAGLRTGRASAGLVEPIRVEAYGTPTPLNQLANISVPEPRMITVQVWDKSMVGAIDKAIRNSGIGLNPVVEGQLLRIPIPPLNEERRAEIAKLAGSYAENARVAVRNVRRDGMDALKKLEKDGVLSEDEHKSYAEDVQKLTDEAIKRVDESLKVKQEEIMQV
ncbi:ribosome recycling factor [Maricaulis sp. CAU 1757]